MATPRKSSASPRPFRRVRSTSNLPSHVLVSKRRAAPTQTRTAARRFNVRLPYLLLIACIALGCDDAPNVPQDNGGGPTCARFDDYLHVRSVLRTPGRTQAVALDGLIAFVASGSDGIRIFDVSNANLPSLETTLSSLNDARDLDAAGGLLIVANGGDGLAVVDVSDPSSASVVGTLTIPGNMVDVALVGARAYFANDALGLVIVDTSNPSAPEILGIENTPGKVIGVAVARNRGCSSRTKRSGLRVVNAADPSSPFPIRTVPIPGAAQAAVEGDIVAVAAREAGLQAFVDVATIVDAAVVGSLDTPVNAVGVDVAGDLTSPLAVVADGFGGVWVVDIAVPSAPRFLRNLGSVLMSEDVAVSDGRLISADEAAGARVVIAAAENPPVDSLVANGDIRALASFGDLVLVADRSFGLHVVDPASRTVVGSLDIPAGPIDVFVADSLVHGDASRRRRRGRRARSRGAHPAFDHPRPWRRSQRGRGAVHLHADELLRARTASGWNRRAAPVRILSRTFPVLRDQRSLHLLTGSYRRAVPRGAVDHEIGAVVPGGRIGGARSYKARRRPVRAGDRAEGVCRDFGASERASGYRGLRHHECQRTGVALYDADVGECGGSRV